MPQLLAQRLYGQALGYADLNAHAFLRRDPLLATACDKLDPLGLDRCNPAFRGAALAAPGTLNRLELSNNKATRCHKLAHDPQAIEACLLTMGARALPKHAQRSGARPRCDGPSPARRAGGPAFQRLLRRLRLSAALRVLR